MAVNTLEGPPRPLIEEPDFFEFANAQLHEPTVVELNQVMDIEAPLSEAERFIRSIGSSAIRGTVENISSPEEEPSDGGSLLESLERAAGGDSEALKSVVTNVKTDVLERVYKVANVLKVKLAAKDGNIWQNGQTIESIYENALLYASETWQIRERSEIETKNGFLLKEAQKLGLLKDHYFVTLSPCADMTDEELKQAGFFEKTKTLVMQAVTESDSSAEELDMASAFVAGVKEAGGERHDPATIGELGDELGVDLRTKSSSETLAKTFLIKKGALGDKDVGDLLMSLVELYDDCAGGTFFGEAKLQQDYSEYMQFCLEREASLDHIVERITSQLLSEVHLFGAMDPAEGKVEAVKRLNELSQYHTVKRAIEDDQIDERVFGEESAAHIQQARAHYAQGDIDMALRAETKAQETADSSSCPSSLKQNKDKDGLPDSVDGQSESNDSKESKESKSGKINCINCRKSVSMKEVVQPNGNWKCPKCNYEVDVCSGKTVSKTEEESPSTNTDWKEDIFKLLENGRLFGKNEQQEDSAQQESKPIALAA